jgi:hypothetical protein
VDDALVQVLLSGQSEEYMLNPKKMNFQDHEDAAVAWGGHLTSILSSEESDHVIKLMKDDDHTQCWIGAKRKEPHEGNGPGPEHWDQDEALAACRHAGR